MVLILAAVALGVMSGCAQERPEPIELSEIQSVEGASPRGDSDGPYRATLHEAVRDGLVVATFRGSGGSSGDVIRLRIRRLDESGGRRLVLSVPPGSRLRSASAAVQDMLIIALRGRDMGGSRYRRESTIDLSDDEPVTYVFSAMCADFDKDNPSEASTFSLIEPDDPVLACIARRGADVDSVQAVQAAVWQHTDGVSYETMSDRFEVSQADWARGETLFQSCIAAR